MLRTSATEDRLMSDQEKPDPTPTTPPTEQPPAATEPAKPDRIGLLREKAASRTPEKVGKVPSLEREQTYGFGKKIDAFDAEMERELQEVMSGVSDRDLLGEQPRGRPKVEQGPKKGRVFRVHGPDVFIDLPGGRSQGVMPLLMFPEGVPAVGTEVEV